ncbi:uncharacterized protein HMPREF1541_08056 [Cyphellophora europaea CBS 101466]|uniref:RRM domain-containing protein n=1 Tax=Cyphellophora europaea (strain CBS 101466) TaxID=1220924 RepID=W2RKQ4_CYPE1|nr:uncharacterized protein HMPREF1541_08056 [Cyphellophora europaea CBS 101466]ETN37066.1 hypothetical protein HMPREF1541_08056 [Cyphellophora europaea CBS 101466]
MATDQKKPLSFDEIIQADRARRKNEQLAQEIFGRNRGNKRGSNKNDRSASNSPSLASRVGVGKVQRSSSSTSTSSQRNPFRPSPSRNTSSQSQRDRANRLSHALNASTPLGTPTGPRPAGGLTIKGKAGPWTIIASNFAPGTTAADIEATLSRDALDSDGQNGFLDCRLTSTHPTVSAELVFSERAIADRIISTYNNQLADNRYLKLSYQKQQNQKQPGQKPAATSTAPPMPPVSAPVEEPAFVEDTDMMAVEETAQPSNEPHPYDDEREAAAASRDRRDRESRRDERDDHRNDPRRDDDRDRRYNDRAYDRDYDDRPRYEGRSSYGSGRGRAYGNSVRGGYARAAASSGHGRGEPRGGYRGYR